MVLFYWSKTRAYRTFGDKMASKVAMKKVGVPVLEGTDEPIIDIEEGAKIAKQIGFPVIIKAAFGGGGRGMRIVREEKDFKELFESASNEAKNISVVVKHLLKKNMLKIQDILRFKLLLINMEMFFI